MPLFLIVIAAYVGFYFLISRFKIPGAWAYIGYLVGVPVFIVVLYMDLSSDDDECVKWNWATGDCMKTIPR
jgi:hypothetical protein